MTKTKNYKSKQIENPKKIFKSQLYQKLKIKVVQGDECL